MTRINYTLGHLQKRAKQFKITRSSPRTRLFLLFLAHLSVSHHRLCLHRTISTVEGLWEGNARAWTQDLTL
ncbi:hypothetical protein AFLA_001775 [Aspergillus flavus NRRL3357]|nr:hypothetical protein AFLA_001775 [Aspergillus flavus NRRL3357]